jgi:hypothetical protein
MSLMLACPPTRDGAHTARSRARDPEMLRRYRAPHRLSVEQHVADARNIGGGRIVPVMAGESAMRNRVCSHANQLAPAVPRGCMPSPSSQSRSYGAAGTAADSAGPGSPASSCSAMACHDGE